MDNTSDMDREPNGISKSTLVRDALVFQLKLLIDGLRDLVLIPVSLIGTVLSLMNPGKHAGSAFYDIVAAGRETEKQINLFEAADRPLPPAEQGEASDLDNLVQDIEGYMRKEFESERFSAARERLQKALGSLDARSRKNGEDG